MSTKKEAYLCLSAMLRAREPKLLNGEKAQRMLDAASFAEAAKLLTAYTVWQGEHMPEPEPPESDAPTEAPAAEEELTVALVPPVQETPAAEEAPAEPVEPSPAEGPPADPQPSEAASLFPLFLAVLAILFLICFLLRLLRIRKKAS